LASASVPISKQPVGPAVTFMAPAGTNMSKYLTGSTASSLPNINSGLAPVMVPSTTKSKSKSKNPTLSQLRNGNMAGGGALTVTIATDSSSVVKSITGSAGTTKVVVKK